MITMTEQLDRPIFAVALRSPAIHVSFERRSLDYGAPELPTLCGKVAKIEIDPLYHIDVGLCSKCQGKKLPLAIAGRAVDTPIGCVSSEEGKFIHWAQKEVPIDDDSVVYYTYCRRWGREAVDTEEDERGFCNACEKAKKKKETKVKARMKPKISNKRRAEVWDYWNGPTQIATCWCCNKIIRRHESWEVGHVQADAKGGDLSNENLRPICRKCNLSMGDKHMDSWKESQYAHIPTRTAFRVMDTPTMKEYLRMVALILKQEAEKNLKDYELLVASEESPELQIMTGYCAVPPPGND
jgi:hypothetical protein